MALSEKTEQELEAMAATLLFKLAKIAKECEDRTCGKCARGELGDEVNAQATAFHAAVLTAKVEGTRFASMVPDVRPSFGGK